MADIYAGCTVARLPGPRAAAAMRFFEYAPKPPLPGFATLARYRKQLSRGVRLTLLAPRSTWLSPQGAMRPGPELDAGVEWLRRTADILEVDAVVVATGAELSTGERDRGLLAEFLERLRSSHRLLVAAPRGLWEPEHGIAFARKTQTVFGFDPLEHEIPPAAVVYARVHPMGARPRLTEGHLSQIAERLIAAASERAYVAIESEAAPRDARRLSQLLGEMQGEAPLEEEASRGRELFTADEASEDAADEPSDR